MAWCTVRIAGANLNHDQHSARHSGPNTLVLLALGYNIRAGRRQQTWFTDRAASFPTVWIDHACINLSGWNRTIDSAFDQRRSICCRLIPRVAPRDPKAGSSSFLGAPSGLEYTDWLYEGNLLISRDVARIMFRRWRTGPTSRRI